MLGQSVNRCSFCFGTVLFTQQPGLPLRFFFVISCARHISTTPTSGAPDSVFLWRKQACNELRAILFRSRLSMPCCFPALRYTATGPRCVVWIQVWHQCIADWLAPDISCSRF